MRTNQFGVEIFENMDYDSDKFDSVEVWVRFPHNKPGWAYFLDYNFSVSKNGHVILVTFIQECQIEPLDPHTINGLYVKKEVFRDAKK